MRVLVFCEETQAVCKAFRRLGHKALSCDIVDCSGGRPGWHIKTDLRNILYDLSFDIMIAHPVCKFLTNSGVRWLFYPDGSKNVQRWNNLKKAIKFFNLFTDHPCSRKAIENPIPHRYAIEGFDGVQGIGKYSQIIQPYQFGHTTSKATCLWLTGLPPLQPTEIIPKEQRTYDVHLCPPGPDRERIRSMTFPGIAKAMAGQWG